MITRTQGGILIVGMFASLRVANDPGRLSDTTGWRRLLSFDMTNAATRKADIGNHTMLIADGGSSRWDIEVRRYPLATNAENLLYDGHNWHGLQDWMLLPQYVTNDPHVIVVPYDNGKCQMKLVVRGVRMTSEAGSEAAFAGGTLEIFHKP